jgi:hypothetical protein
LGSIEADGMVKGWNSRTRRTKAISRAKKIVLMISKVSLPPPDLPLRRPPFLPRA